MCQRSRGKQILPEVDYSSTECFAARQAGRQRRRRWKKRAWLGAQIERESQFSAPGDLLAGRSSQRLAVREEKVRHKQINLPPTTLCPTHATIKGMMLLFLFKLRGLHPKLLRHERH